MDAVIATLGISIGLTACGTKEPESTSASPPAVTEPAAAPSAPSADASFEANFGISPYPGAKLTEVQDGTGPANPEHVRGNIFNSPDALAKVVAYYRDQLKRYTAGAPARTDGMPPIDEMDLKDEGFNFAVGDIGKRPSFSVWLSSLKPGPGTEIKLIWAPLEKTQP
jgi:hypothetical protein